MAPQGRLSSEISMDLILGLFQSEVLFHPNQLDGIDDPTPPESGHRCMREGTARGRIRRFISDCRL
jgi:hypothetical protein